MEKPNCLCCNNRLCVGATRVANLLAEMAKLREELQKERELNAFLLGEASGKEKKR